MIISTLIYSELSRATIVRNTERKTFGFSAVVVQKPKSFVRN